MYQYLAYYNGAHLFLYLKLSSHSFIQHFLDNLCDLSSFSFIQLVDLSESRAILVVCVHECYSSVNMHVYVLICSVVPS